MSVLPFDNIQDLWTVAIILLLILSEFNRISSLYTPRYSHLFPVKFGFKGTLMQIWNSHYMFVFIWKQYSENFAFLILKTLELSTREICKLFKKQANF